MKISPLMKISIILVDCDPIRRKCAHTLLGQASDILIAESVDDAHEAIAMLTKIHPKIILVILGFYGAIEPGFIESVAQISPCTIPLLLTSYNSTSLLMDMRNPEIVGYLDENEFSSDLVDAIRHAAHGQELFSFDQRTKAREWLDEVKGKWDRLNARERDIFRLVMHGMDNKNIARAMYISQKTVEYHITHILFKLEVKSCQEAVAWILKHSPEATLWQKTEQSN
jgi:DNA-binding NarL/FixJ family response regulator